MTSYDLRYSCNDKDLDAIQALRYRRYLRDARKGLQHPNHKTQRLGDELDPYARQLMLFHPSGELIGGMRTNWVSETPRFPDYIENTLELAELARLFGADKVTYSSGLVLDAAERGASVSSLLGGRMFMDGLAQGVLVDVCLCELNLVHLYQAMGYRPYLPSFSVPGAGRRFPLILCIQDIEYLRRIDAKLLPAYLSDRNDHGETAETLRKRFQDFHDPGIEPMGQKAFWTALSCGPGAADPKAAVFQDVDIEKISKEIPLTSISLKAQETLYRMGETEIGMVLVESGRLGITLSPEPNAPSVAIRGPGEPVGEIHSLLGTGRTAHVKAIEDTQLLALPPNYIERVAKKNPQAGYQLALNMARIIARKLADETAVLARCRILEGIPSPQRPQRSYEAPSPEEQRRLALQADEFVEREIRLLRSLGLLNDKRVLDVGCGKGKHCIAIKRSLPSCEVHGVDVNADFVQEAIQNAKDTPGCVFELGSASELPYADASFDFVFSRLVMQHLPDPAAAVREIARVLAPNGKLVLIDIDDAGILVDPEPATFCEVIVACQEAKRTKEGNRYVGRTLLRHLRHERALDDPKLQVITISSLETAIDQLSHLAFGFRREILEEAGSFDPRKLDSFEQDIEDLKKNPDALIMLPVFVASARKRAPKNASPSMN